VLKLLPVLSTRRQRNLSEYFIGVAIALRKLAEVTYLTLVAVVPRYAPGPGGHIFDTKRRVRGSLLTRFGGRRTIEMSLST